MTYENEKINPSVFFSICVPTRNRTATLVHCLKTLIHQDFEDYEILISDNSDEPESLNTLKILQELNSTKIKYFKPERILSMTENFEFILSKAKGKFILFMGDDDGLVINSLNYVFSFINNYDAGVVKCPSITFHWPGSLSFPSSRLSYPLDKPVTEIHSKSIIQKVASFQLAYFNLPMIYYAFVNKKLIDEVIAERGSFFHDSCSVDVYSGFVIAYKTKKYFIADIPFTIAGLSGKSNGESASKNDKNKITNEFVTSHNIEWQLNQYQIPKLPVIDLDTFVLLELLRFKKKFELSKDVFPINNKNLLVRFISNDAVFNNKTNLGLGEYFKDFDLYKSDIDVLTKIFLHKQIYYPNVGKVDNIMVKHELIDPNLFCLKNVYDVAVFCKKIIDSKASVVPIEINNMATYLNVNARIKRTFVIKVTNRLKRTFKVLIGKE